MRPVYETPADKEKENTVAQALADLWGFRLVPTPKLDGVDRIIWAPALLEIKCRNIPHDKYPTLLISKSKIDNALARSEHLHAPLYLAIQWSDTLGYLHIHTADFPVEITGNLQRNDGMGDVEPCYMIPISSFTFTTPPDPTARAQKRPPHTE